MDAALKERYLAKVKPTADHKQTLSDKGDEGAVQKGFAVGVKVEATEPFSGMPYNTVADRTGNSTNWDFRRDVAKGAIGTVKKWKEDMANYCWVVIAFGGTELLVSEYDIREHTKKVSGA